MGGEIIIIFIVFGTLFGIAYLFFNTRHRERLALIEKGSEADIFVKHKRGRMAYMLKLIMLNLALVVMGIGAGVFLGALVNEMGVSTDTAMPGSIFMMAGLGLYAGFTQTRKMDKEDSEMNS